MAEDKYAGTRYQCVARDWFGSQIDEVHALNFYAHLTKIETLREFLRETSCEHDAHKIYTNDNNACALICRTDILHENYKLKILSDGYVVVVWYKNRHHDIFWMKDSDFYRFFSVIPKVPESPAPESH